MCITFVGAADLTKKILGIGGALFLFWRKDQREKEFNKALHRIKGDEINYLRVATAKPELFFYEEMSQKFGVDFNLEMKLANAQSYRKALQSVKFIDPEITGAYEATLLSSIDRLVTSKNEREFIVYYENLNFKRKEFLESMGAYLNIYNSYISNFKQNP